MSVSRRKSVSMMGNRSLFRRLRRLESEITPPTRGVKISHARHPSTAPAVPEAPTNSHRTTLSVRRDSGVGRREREVPRARFATTIAHK
ncbi:unnamed protein product [Ectocarpus fasciculatus]